MRMRCLFGDTECELPMGGGATYANRCRYVWGDNVHKAKTQCESIDYILQLAVEMKKLGLPWTK
jgi:CO dehydrogenase/acetyl-CoA synthase delta subunit